MHSLHLLKKILKKNCFILLKVSPYFLTEPRIYKLNTLHSKHVIFLIDAQLHSKLVWNIILQTAVRMVELLYIETVSRLWFL